MKPRPRRILRSAVAALLLLAGGCRSPLAIQTERDLRNSVLESVRRELSDSQLYPQPIQTISDADISRLQIKPELYPELDAMAGPASYQGAVVPLGPDLRGQAARTRPVSLERAIRSAVQNNLQVQFARLAPAIQQTQVVQAEAAFDWTFFSNSNAQKLDEPRSVSGFGSVGVNESNILNNQTGLRRPMVSGGQFTVQQDLSYTDIDTPGLFVSPNPADEVALTLQYDQPLLRNFGSDVSLAQVRLARNAERDSVASLKRDLIQVVTDTETAYWDLVQARWDLLILQRLLERGERVRDQVQERRILDAKQAQIADAVSRVENRRSNLIRAQNLYRQASDRLKALMNDPEYLIGTETVLSPVDEPLDAPIQFSHLDALTDAVRNRPEIQQAVLSIDDTSVRLIVADNSRLPQLDLRMQMRFAGQDTNFGDAYSDVAQGQFIDYLLGLVFEQPIGNRRAEAVYDQRRFERMQAVIAYRNTVQQVILETDTALNNVVTNYRLMGQSRIERLAAAENLRTFMVEKELEAGVTVQSLDLEFRFQDNLAESERQEIAAQVNYNTALANYYKAIGTALERNKVQFDVPDVTGDTRP